MFMESCERLYEDIFQLHRSRIFYSFIFSFFSYFGLLKLVKTLSQEHLRNDNVHSEGWYFADNILFFSSFFIIIYFLLLFSCDFVFMYFHLNL